MGSDGDILRFVNNIPPNVHWLKKIFQHHGNVVDVFIPVKRKGRKFGFVRFDNFSDARNAIDKLNGAWLMDFRILGKEVSHQNPRNATDIPGCSGPQICTIIPSFKDVFLKGLNVMEAGETDSHPCKVECNQIRKSCQASCDRELLSKLQTCYIGATNILCDLDSLQDECKVRGLLDVLVRRTSGNFVLLGYDQNETRNLLENWKDSKIGF
ncbi:hypothetical protein REPUB_Repub09cG0144500 [Reevesia pubescens]